MKIFIFSLAVLLSGCVIKTEDISLCVSLCESREGLESMHKGPWSVRCRCKNGMQLSVESRKDR